MNKTYHLTTYGCQMNKSDSERIDSILNSADFKKTSQDKADILIFNLCSVRQSSIDRVWGLLDNIKNQKSKIKNTNKKLKNNSPLIILTGCILEADRKKFEKKVNLILNITDLPNWPNQINSLITHYTLHITHYTLPTPNNSPKKYVDYFAPPPQYTSSCSAYVPIMTGCDNFCAYCAVPYTRGPEYSRPVADILNEVNKLVVQGYKMITLLGQNVNSYNSKICDDFLLSSSRKRGSSELSQKHIFWIPAFAGMTKSILCAAKKSVVDFSALLKLIDSIPGNYWLSFLTSHPKDMSDELISCFKDCQHLMPYLHLPIQSGADKILKAMNRKYTVQDYLKLIKKIRMIFVSNSHQNSHITISTDMIVGFPGETKKDFQATASLMKKVKFDMAYIAEYSPRQSTSAYKLKDNVTRQEKTRRREILTEILKRTALENNKKMVGKIVDVLIESIKTIKTVKSIKKFYLGKTKNFKNVRINLNTENTKNTLQLRSGQAKTQKTLVGQFIKVKIIKAGAWGVEGEMNL